MKLQVLGCAGGIGGRERFTTCLWLDTDILIDAGTGLSSLNLDQLARIDHVFLTHGHLDHVAGLALLVDAVMGRRTRPIMVHATEKVIAALKTNLFNWTLWPDFTKIPNEHDPIFRWEPMHYGETIALGGRRITSHPVNHTVDAVGYMVKNDRAGFLFTGDMSSTPELWGVLKNEKTIAKVIVDCSFSNSEFDLAALSKHFCPRSLIADLGQVSSSIEFLIYHLKAGQEDLIMEELRAGGGRHAFKALKRDDIFVF
jgi:cAMP phosphodiesterase